MRNLNFTFLFKLFLGLMAVVLISCNGQQEEKTEDVVAALELQYIDSTVNPGDDFFQFVNGGWLKDNPVPDDKTRWGVFNVLVEENNDKIKTIIDDAVNDKTAEKGSSKKKIGDFYASGMDTLNIEKAGVTSLQPEFEMIEAMQSIQDVQNLAAKFQIMGVPAFFYVFAGADQKNSKMMIANMWQAGLGMPDRDYYTSDDERSTDLRVAYIDHLSKMFMLLGDEESVAKANADKVMEIETNLAKASFTMLENRNPQKTYNKLSIDELTKIAPALDWKTYMNNLGYSAIDSLNVSQLSFVEGLSKVMLDVPVKDWKTFFRWKLIDNTASYLSDA